MDSKLNNFNRAFHLGIFGPDAVCSCGKVFEENDLYDYGYVRIENKDYVDYCDCWHDKARKIISFLEVNQKQIVSYLTYNRNDIIRDLASDTDLKSLED